MVLGQQKALFRFNKVKIIWANEAPHITCLHYKSETCLDFRPLTEPTYVFVVFLFLALALLILLYCCYLLKSLFVIVYNISSGLNHQLKFWLNWFIDIILKVGVKRSHEFIS